MKIGTELLAGMRAELDLCPIHTNHPIYVIDVTDDLAIKSVQFMDCSHKFVALAGWERR